MHDTHDIGGLQRGCQPGLVECFFFEGDGCLQFTSAVFADGFLKGPYVIVEVQLAPLIEFVRIVSAADVVAQPARRNLVLVIL